MAQRDEPGHPNGAFLPVLSEAHWAIDGPLTQMRSRAPRPSSASACARSSCNGGAERGHSDSARRARAPGAGQRCTFTLAEAAAGIDVAYAVVVDAPLASVTVRPQVAGGCGAPGSSALITFEQLGGGGQGYCLCDTGPCAGGDRTVDLAAGSYSATFHWTGRNRGGPSDTGVPTGAPFPAGDYTLRVSATGTYASASFTVASTFPIHLVPWAASQRQPARSRE